MDTYKFLWIIMISMDIYRYLLISILLLISMDIHGFLWISVDFYGLISIDIPRYQWISVDGAYLTSEIAPLRASEAPHLTAVSSAASNIADLTPYKQYRRPRKEKAHATEGAPPMEIHRNLWISMDSMNILGCLNDQCKTNKHTILGCPGYPWIWNSNLSNHIWRRRSRSCQM